MGRRKSVSHTFYPLPKKSSHCCPPTSQGTDPQAGNCGGPPAWPSPAEEASAWSSAAGDSAPGTCFLEDQRAASCPHLKFTFTEERIWERCQKMSPKKGGTNGPLWRPFRSWPFSPVIYICDSPLRNGSLSLNVSGMTRNRTSATRSHCFNTLMVQVPGRSGCCRGGLYWVYSASTSTVMSYDAATTRPGSIHTMVAVRLGPRAHFCTASGSSRGPITPPKLRKILSLGSHSVPIWQWERQKVWRHNQGDNFFSLCV